MKTLLISLLILGLHDIAEAQGHNNPGALAVSLGAAASYYYGGSDRNFGKFENERVNWQINGMLGLTLARDKGDRRTIIGAFGSFGINNDHTINRIFEDQKYVTTAVNQGTNNNSYQLEGGLLISEILRISTGVGQQIFNRQVIASSDGLDIDATSLKYNSTTVGVIFNVGPVGLAVNCNFNYGRDYTKTVFNPSAGLNFRF